MSEETLPQDSTARRHELDAFWMPFTANRQFKQQPRLLESARGMHYTTVDGRQILDGTAGLWCCNLGHGRPEINAAVSAQIAKMEFAPTFQMGHPLPFQLAQRLARHSPPGLNRVFFTNSGSESVDSALKIALAYHRLRGEGHRQRLIGRQKGYHGVGFGGISVGGIPNNRKYFGALLPGIDHLKHTLDLRHNAFSRGQPSWGDHLANELEELAILHDPSSIAAVIVEPVSGSAGVILPPVGYLERLREICDDHGILLIFDEVITGFGRLGAPFGADFFGVVPDMITSAKGLTNGAIPMGAVFVRDDIYDTFMKQSENPIELFHGYTYSGHPVACAAAMAALDVYEKEGLFRRAADLADYWEDAVHSLADRPHVIDVRNLGLIAGIELEPLPGKPTARAFEVFLKAFERGIMIRSTGDTLAMSPPLVIERHHIDQLVGTLADILTELA